MQITEGKLSFLKSQAWFHFVRSNYVTWFTSWLLGLGGKSAHVVLICTTLYMSAQLYPGVSLPAWLNLTVFIVQMFALDMGGLGLASLARQARKDNNITGADKADKLSRWLIGMMIAGLVTVSLEQAVSRIPHVSSDIQTWLDIIKIVISLALVVARSVCAVLYGRVVHDLESKYPTTIETAIAPAPEIHNQLAEMVTRIESLTLTITQITQSTGGAGAQNGTQTITPDDTFTTPVQPLAMVDAPDELLTIEGPRNTDELEAIARGFSEGVQAPSQPLVNPGDSTVSLSREADIRAVLAEEPGMSAQQIARRVGCSVTTANNWKKRIEA